MFIKYAILKQNSWPQRCMVGKQEMIPCMKPYVYIQTISRALWCLCQPDLQQNHHSTKWHNWAKLSFMARDWRLLFQGFPEQSITIIMIHWRISSHPRRDNLKRACDFPLRWTWSSFRDADGCLFDVNGLIAFLLPCGILIEEHAGSSGC